MMSGRSGLRRVDGSVVADRARLPVLRGADADALAAERPRTRGDCLSGGRNAQRPCPWVSCAAHLALDVRDRGAYATVRETFPGVEVWDMPETCALDVADRGGAALEEVAALMNLTPERAGRVEALAVERVLGPGD
jgi:hypothetical protein